MGVGNRGYQRDRIDSRLKAKIPHFPSGNLPKLEVARMTPQAYRVRDFLARRGLQGADNVEIANSCFCLRYGARIAELRREGYNISVSRISKGRFQYVLVSPPAERRA